MTKEEIEKLAELQFPSAITKECCKFGFIKGYQKCQEDMTDKKYTLRDIEKAFLEGCASERRFSRRTDELDNYINSLNKQD